MEIRDRGQSRERRHAVLVDGYDMRLHKEGYVTKWKYYSDDIGIFWAQIYKKYFNNKYGIILYITHKLINPYTQVLANY